MSSWVDSARSELRSLTIRSNLCLDARFYVSILVLIVLVSFSPNLVFADSVNDPDVDPLGDPGAGGNSSELAEGLLSLLDASRSQIQAILEQYALDGIILPDEVYSMFSLAEEAHSEVLLLMEGGMYEEAALRATEALQLYGDVLLMALNSPVQGSIVEDESSDLQELWATLERGYAYLTEVQDATRQLAESGVDVASVEGFIVEAEMYLAQAEAFLLQGDAEGAGGELDSAFQFLDVSMMLLNSLNEDLTAEKAAGFLVNSERRLERLEEDIMSLVDPLSMEPEDFDALLQALEDAHLKNRDLKDLLEGGDLSAIMGELEGIQGHSDIFGLLEGGDEDVAKHLKKAYKVEVRASRHDDEGDPKGFEASTSDPKPGNDEDPKGGNSKGKPNKNDNQGNGGQKSSGSSEGNNGGGNDTPSNNSQGDKGKGNRKNNGGGLKKGHSNKSQETE